MHPKGMTPEQAYEAFAKLRAQAKAHFGDKPRSGAEFDAYIQTEWAKMCGVEHPKPKPQTTPREPAPPQLTEVTGPKVSSSGSPTKTFGEL